jgi:MarR family transcriptional regulator, 2-MHQ and catechol-resistance regulon repressor
MKEPAKDAGRGSAGAAPGRVDPRHATVLKLFTVLSRAHSSLVTRAREDVARHGLTITEFAVLDVLYHKGPLLLGVIKEKILASSGGITYLVDRLSQRGLVERRECPEDRRARYAALTRDGVALMDRIFPEHAECLSDASRGLSPEEQEEAILLLKALGWGARESGSPLPTPLPDPLADPS